MSRSIAWLTVAVVLIVVLIPALAGCDDTGDSGPSPARTPQPAALALTPPMGWSSWNGFGCDISARMIEDQAEAMVALGLRELGYVYVNIDDCWMADERAADGAPQADPERFPFGIEPLADRIHGLGLKLGIYSSPGEQTCNQLPGSHKHEDIDARTYAEWGVDYLKYDRCSAPADEVAGRFVRMRNALDKVDRPIVLSINPNGGTWDRPWSDIAQLWRTTPDIKPVMSAECSWWCGVLDIADRNEPLGEAAGPGGWNDPDMLEIGVASPFHGRLDAGEARLHMSLWAIMAAPLIAGADLTALDDVDLAVYGNAEVIAVDQDLRGIQGWRVRDDGDTEVWMKPLAMTGARAVALVNRSDQPRTITVRWSELWLEDDALPVRDLWAHRDLGAHAHGYTALVPGHDVAMLRTVGDELVSDDDDD